VTRAYRGPSRNGAANPAAKLSASDVELMREAFDEGASLAAIAESAGISRTHVRRILSGQAWGSTVRRFLADRQLPWSA